MGSELSHFATGLAAIQLTEVEVAVALLWFIEETGEAPEASAADLARTMHDLALKPAVNVSRLAVRLRLHSATVQGKAPGAFRVRLGSKPQLAERYAGLLEVRPPLKIAKAILPPDAFAGTRRHLEKIVYQINGTYEMQFYDGCAVLCRRLMETLLIEAFEKAGKGAAIKHQGEYLPLSGVLSAARSGQHIKLPRGAGDVLEEVKNLGDAAAHSRTYITRKADIDHLTLNYRRVISDLAHLADIKPKAS